MGDERLALAAVWNNASWCDAVATAHGCTTRTDDAAWTSATRTPPFYPDAITRSPSAGEADLLARVDSGDGCGVKDSFACLDLSRQGFRVLLEGRWVLMPRRDPLPPPSGWSTVGTSGELDAWERAWAGQVPDRRTFPESLAAHPACRFVALVDDGTIVAGAALHRAHGVVGVSNLFGPRDRVDRTWAEVVALAAAAGEPLVGWESGDDLDAARRAGFEAGAPLRVWVR